MEGNSSRTKMGNDQKKPSTSEETYSEETNPGLPDICGVCLAKYNDRLRVPKMLICGHTLCRSCVHGVFSHRGKIACPFCRKAIPTRFNHISTNYQLLQLLQKMSLLDEEPDTKSELPKVEEDTSVDIDYYNQVLSALESYRHRLDDLVGNLNERGIDSDVQEIAVEFADERSLTFDGVLFSARNRITEMESFLIDLGRDIDRVRTITDIVYKQLDEGKINTAQLAIHIKLSEEVIAELPERVRFVPIHETLQYPLFTLGPGRRNRTEEETRRMQEALFHYDNAWSSQSSQSTVPRYSPSQFDILSPSPPPNEHTPPLYDDEWRHQFNGYDAPIEGISNNYCEICHCRVPGNRASQQIHCNGRRHTQNRMNTVQIGNGRIFGQVEFLLHALTTEPSTSTGLNNNNRGERNESNRRNRGTSTNRGNNRGRNSRGVSHNRGRGNQRGRFNGRGRNRGDYRPNMPHNQDFPDDIEFGANWWYGPSNPYAW